MPRRPRRSEYIEDVDGVEPEMYLPRHRGEYILEPDTRHSHHRAPSAPRVEIVERRHVRDRSEPQLFHYARENIGSVPGIHHPEELMMRKSERRRIKQHSSYEPRGRRRSRNMEIEEEQEEDTYHSFEEDSEQKFTDGSESDDQAEEEEEVVTRKRRDDRSIPRHGYDIQREILPRSRSLKEEMKEMRSHYEANGAYPRRSDCGREYVDKRKVSRYETPSGSQHRYFDEEDEVDDDDRGGREEPIMITRRRQRRQPRREVFEEETMRSLESLSSSSSSSSSSSLLSEPEIPRAPSPVRVPQIVKDPGPPIPPVVSLPLVPSPETAFAERDIRPRRRRKERAHREEILVEEREKDRAMLPLQNLPPEPFTRRKKEHVLDIPQGYELESERALIEGQRRGPSSTRKREIVEEEYYQRWNTEAPPLNPMPGSMLDDWAVVKTPDTTPAAKEELASQPPRHSRRRERRTKLMEDDEQDPGQDKDLNRGKVGRRYIGVKDRRDRLWTEITKDLVVKDAIERAGYEYEETESFYYIFSYLHHDDVSALIKDSDDIRRARRRRIQQIHRERASLPPPPKNVSTKSIPVAPEKPPSPRRHPREERRRREWEEQVVDDPRWRARSGRW